MSEGAARVLKEVDQMLNDFIDNISFCKVNVDAGNEVTLIGGNPNLSGAELQELKGVAAEEGAGSYTHDPLSDKWIKLDGAEGAYRGMKLSQITEGTAGQTLNADSTMQKISARLNQPK